MPTGTLLRTDNSQAVQLLSETLATAVTLISGRETSGVEAIARSIRATIERPVDWYFEHAHWPSRLTANGFPVELSITIDGQGAASVRYIVDLSDHWGWLAENWTRYLRAAAELTGAPVPILFSLLTTHLHQSPSTVRSPVLHGLRYGPGGVRHSTLYLFVDLLRAAFEERFPEFARAIDRSLAGAVGHGPSRYSFVSFDFSDTGKHYRTKSYGWLTFEESEQRLTLLAAEQPALAAAEAFVNQLRQMSRADGAMRPILFQSSLSGRPSRCRHKMLLNASDWGFDDREVFKEVVAYFLKRSARLDPLYTLLSVFEVGEVPLLPTWIGIGGGRDVPSLSFYFLPVFDAGVAASSRSQEDNVDRMLLQGLRYLFAVRSPDGSWRDGEGGSSGFVLTARLARALSLVSEARDTLGSTADWLARQPGAREGEAEQLEAASHARIALQRLDRSVQSSHVDDAPVGLPEITALQLLAGVESGTWSDDAIGDSVASLSQSERWRGGWSGAADDLLVTVRVVDALTAVAASASSSSANAAELLRRSKYCFSESPMRAEGNRIGLWLKGWLLCGQNPIHPRLTRALAQLAAEQQHDGSWRATPFQPSSGERPYLDPRSLTTTAIVVEALALLRRHYRSAGEAVPQRG